MPSGPGYVARLGRGLKASYSVKALRDSTFRAASRDRVVQHGAILHIWTHESLDNPALNELADQMTIFVNSNLTALVPGPQPKGYDPAPILLWALLIEFPYTMSVQLPELDRDELRELLQLMIHYGLPAIRSGVALQHGDSGVIM